MPLTIRSDRIDPKNFEEPLNKVSKTIPGEWLIYMDLPIADEPILNVYNPGNHNALLQASQQGRLFIPTTELSWRLDEDGKFVVVLIHDREVLPQEIANLFSNLLSNGEIDNLVPSHEEWILWGTFQGGKFRENRIPVPLSYPCLSPPIKEGQRACLEVELYTHNGLVQFCRWKKFKI